MFSSIEATFRRLGRRFCKKFPIATQKKVLQKHTGEKVDSSIIFQPFFLSSEMQIILFGSGAVQFECITPSFRPQPTVNISPLTNSYSLVSQSEKKSRKCY